MQYVFAICEKDSNYYDGDEVFSDPNEAIKLSLEGYEIAVLDALSLEYYGTI